MQLLLLLTAAATMDLHGPWSWIAEGQNGTVVYAGQVESIDRAHPSLWVRFDHSRDNKIAARESIARFDISCMDNHLRMERYTSFAPNGKAIASRKFLPGQSETKNGETDHVTKAIVYYACGPGW